MERFNNTFVSSVTFLQRIVPPKYRPSDVYYSGGGVGVNGLIIKRDVSLVFKITVLATILVV